MKNLKTMLFMLLGVICVTVFTYDSGPPDNKEKIAICKADMQDYISVDQEIQLISEVPAAESVHLTHAPPLWNSNSTFKREIIKSAETNVTTLKSEYNQRE